MVKNRHGPELIRPVHFHNPSLQSLGLDTLTVAQLRGKCPPAHFARPERLEFYQLIHLTGGKGGHLVDFRAYRIRRSTLIVARPKQVQQFQLNPSLKGRLLLIEPIFLEASSQTRPGSILDIERWPAWLEMPEWLDRDVARTLDLVARETAAYRGDALTARFLQHTVMALLLEIQRFAFPGGDTRQAYPSDLLRLLKAEVETNFARERSVTYYASRLGYSEKTLTRACLAAEGRTAKQMIDQRVTLEAKRLLAHSRASLADIGGQLGFSDATNFVKFFKRNVHATPAQFRSHLLAGSAGKLRDLHEAPVRRHRTK